MRAEFPGMVSHELRVPLTSIKGSTAAALGAARLMAPAETREFFRIIDDQADRMIGLIADLLDAGRIEAGTLSVSPEPSEAGALVDQARSTFVSGGGRHAVRIDLPPGLPPVLADRQRIVQVLNNLLANAARHSPDSAPTRIAAERDGVHVAVSVADEGRGIAPERLGQLFRKYTATGDREGGVGGGLGLAAAPEKAEAQTEVYENWSLKPDGVNVGERFRLLFVTSTAKNASTTVMDSYNGIIRDAVAAGHRGIRAYRSSFKALGSTAAVDARDNTSTTHTAGDTGVPIYYLNGDKVADDYEDFYDGTWDSHSPKDEFGNSSSANADA